MTSRRLSAGSAAKASRRSPGSGRNPSSPMASPAVAPALRSSRRVVLTVFFPSRLTSRDREGRGHRAERSETSDALLGLGLAGLADRLIGWPPGTDQDGISGDGIASAVERRQEMLDGETRRSCRPTDGVRRLPSAGAPVVLGDAENNIPASTQRRRAEKETAIVRQAGGRRPAKETLPGIGHLARQPVARHQFDADAAGETGGECQRPAQLGAARGGELRRQQDQTDGPGNLVRRGTVLAPSLDRGADQPV